MTPPSIRKLLTTSLALLLSVALMAPEAEARKKKKGKKKKKKPKAEVVQTETGTPAGLASMPAAVRDAERFLLAYDTEAASRAVGDDQHADDAWAETARGRVLEQNRNYDAAATKLERAAALDERNPAPLLFLGDTYAYANRESSAAEAYAKAEGRARDLLKAKSDSPEALYYLGAAQQRLSKLADASDALEKALAQKPDDASILFELGVTRFRQEKFQEASELFSEALAKNPGIAYAYYYRGLAASKLQRKDLLFNDLDQFVKMAPKAPEAVSAKQILASFG